MQALSDAARSVWAKARPYGTAVSVEAWLPLWRHLDDTAAVAGKIWDVWLAPATRRVIARSVGDEAAARCLVRFLAGIHDIGKATPAFAVQSRDLAHDMGRAGLVTPPALTDRNELRHELAGALILTDWLNQRHGWRAMDTMALSVVVGGHHGVPPTNLQLDRGRQRRDLRGGGVWTEVQVELLDRQSRYLGNLDLTACSGHMRPNEQAQVLMTAIVILADWIASNEDYFPLTTYDKPDERLARAWSVLDLPSAWRAKPERLDPDQLMGNRFGLKVEARPVQRAALQLARDVDVSGLMIIEAPMGEGKTEAALLAAEVMAARTGAGGCFIALPTQATTDAMFTRVRRWIERLPIQPDSDPSTLFLAHGKASLNDEYRGLIPTGRITDVAREDAAPGSSRRDLSSEMVSHVWLRGRKKGVLSSFVVGTIDQVLFGALKSKHLVLRHLALAQKVVIIDEVHAYDAYMSSYLDRVLHWLGAYGVPTILLSATLPIGRRDDMLRVYQVGSGSAAVELTGSDPAYPVLVATNASQPVRLVAPPPSGRGTAVHLETCADDDVSVGELLSQALAGGGCAVVIRNTVARVQATAAHLRTLFAHEDVIVAHARFLAADRAENDAALLAQFGPPGDGVERPQTRVVVASQVVEQSLDLDFDLLITDLAPVDLVLQRMGRLHRHDRGDHQSDRPETLRTARCVLVGADWSTAPPTPVPGSRRVYSDYVLLRSAAAFRPHLEEGRDVRLPEDISPLVQGAYGDAEIGPPEWLPAIADARERHLSAQADRIKKARTFQIRAVGRSDLRDWLAAGVGDVDADDAGQAQVRDGQASLEVLVVCRDDDGRWLLPPWVSKVGGKILSTELEIEPWQARLVAACSLRLPVVMCLPGRIEAVLLNLERNFVDAWQRSPLLAGQLVLVLDLDGRAQIGGFDLHYTRDRGLEIASL